MNRKMLDPRRGTPSSGNSPKSPRKFNLMWIYLIIGFFLLGLLFVKPQNAGQKEIKWSDFTEYAKEGVFSSITLDRSNFKAVAEKTPQKSTTVFSKRELKQLDNRNFSFINTKELKNYGVSTEVPSMDAFDTFIRDNAIQTPVEYKTKSRIWTSLLFNVVPFILIIFFWYYIMRGAMSRGGAGGGIFNVGL